MKISITRWDEATKKISQDFRESPLNIEVEQECLFNMDTCAFEKIPYLKVEEFTYYFPFIYLCPCINYNPDKDKVPEWACPAYLAHQILRCNTIFLMRWAIDGFWDTGENNTFLEIRDTPLRSIQGVDVLNKCPYEEVVSYLNSMGHFTGKVNLSSEEQKTIRELIRNNS